MNTAGHGAGHPSQKIAIIGMGCLFPNARDVQEFWRSLRRGEDGITDIPESHWPAEDYFDPDPKRPDHVYCARGGFVPPVAFDPTEFGIPPNILEATDTTQLLGLVVAKAALEDAGFGEGRDFNRDRVSVILGVTGTQELVLPLSARLGHPLWRRALSEAGVSPEVAERVVSRIADGYVQWQENSFPGLLGNVIAGRIANRLNLRGTNCVVDAACASSLSAAHLAMLELADGRCDMAITGGVDALNNIFMYMCFSKTPALSPTGDARPFSCDADGTVLGEGVGMLVLKRLEDAERDGDRIYAVLRSIGTSSDGRSQSIYAPHSGGQARALRDAYRLAGVDPGTVELIEAHGTGTKVGDVAEFEALRTVFREARSDGNWCALGSVKSQIGHTKSAAGAAGLIKAALAIYHRVLPPTIKVSQPNAKLDIDESPFYLSTEPRPWLPRADHPRRAGVSAFGFGGSNYHAVMEAYHAVLPVAAWDGSVQIIALSAESVDALRGLLDRWLAAAEAAHFGRPELAFRAAESRRAFSVEHDCRLLLVVENGTDVAGLLRQARARLGADSDRLQTGPTTRPPAATKLWHRRPACDATGETPVPQISSRAAKKSTVSSTGWSLPDVHYGRGAAEGRLAFLFPGQGSQYVGMGRELACTFPEMLDVLAEAEGASSNGERLSGSIHPRPVFCDDERNRQAAALTRTEVAQPALGAVNLGMCRVLERFGLRPDVTAGHSYGELVALCVAGRFDPLTLHRLSRLRGRLMTEGDGDRGTMLAVKAPLDDLGRLIEEAGLDVVLANRNAPGQGVLSGPRAAVAEAALLCKERGFATRPLKVSGAFHSRLMEGAVDSFRNALEAVPFDLGAVGVYANATGRAYPDDPGDARALLAEQLVCPVDFVGEIENLYQTGVRTFVEVGPKTVLAGLVRAILGDRPNGIVSMDASSGRCGGGADLARLLARLAAEGRPVDLTRWERPAAEPRKPKMVVQLTGANYRAPREKTSAPVAAVGSAVRTDHSAARVFEKGSQEQSRDRKGAVLAVEQGPLPDGRGSDLGHGASSSSSNAAGIREAARAEARGSSDAETGSPDDRPKVLGDALRIVQEGLRAMQALQQQTAEAHRRFLEGQEQAHKTLQALMDAQGGLLTGGGGASESVLEERSQEQSRDREGAVFAPETGPQEQSRDRKGAVLDTETGPLPDGRGSDLGRGAPSSSDAAGIREAARAEARGSSDVASIESVVLEVVCEKTGYPAEMIDMNMDIEADLGVDSIKRVEIIAGIEERMPSWSGVQPDHMGSIRTLRQIVDFVAASLPQLPADVAAAPSESKQPDGGFAETLLVVVSELTGYPAEMLNLDMDMEADLGIDSIKRVEILAAVEARMPDLPPVQPDSMASLRTLRQIVEYCESGKQTGSPKSEAHAAAPASEKVFQKQPQEQSRDREGAVFAVEQGPLPKGRGSDPSRDREGAVFVAKGGPLPDGRGSDQASNAPSETCNSPPRVKVDRRVLATVDLPAANGGSLRVAPDSEIWVTDDGGGLAAEIARQLVSARCAARVVPLSQASAEEKRARVGGLILLAPAVEAPGTIWAEESEKRLKAAFYLTQAVASDLRAAAAGGGALLATVSRMDGAFGLIGGPFDPTQGGLAGLAKTAALEWPDVRCRAIDLALDWDDTESAAAAVLQELAASGPVEVGLGREARRGLELVGADVSQEVPSQEQRCDTPKSRGLQPARSDEHHDVQQPLSAGDVVVITGGARGVTAEAALALAGSVQPTLVLIGRSPPPFDEPDWLAGIEGEGDIKQAVLTHAFAGRADAAPADVQAACGRYAANREVRRNLDRIRAAGADVYYRSVDVRDPTSVREAVDDIRATLGPVRCLVHAAGVLADRRIEDKTPSQFDAVFDTKVQGLRFLLEALPRDELGHVVLFSSVSGRMGNPGQADYAMANEVLNKVAQRLAAALPSCRVKSLNWGPWDGGMVRAQLKRAFQQRGIELIPLEAGARCLVEEMCVSPRVFAKSSYEQSRDREGAVFAAEGGPLPNGRGSDPSRDREGAVLDSETRPLSYGRGSDRASNTPSQDAAVEVVLGAGLGPSARADAVTGGRGDAGIVLSAGAPCGEVCSGVDADEGFVLAFERVLDLDRHAFLKSHVLDGRPVLPLAIIMEWLAHAAVHGNPGLRLHGLDDVRVLKGVVVDGPAPVLRLVTGKARRSGSVFDVPVELWTAGPEGREVRHVRATAVLAPTLPPAPSADVPKSLAERRYERGVEAAYREILFHGEHFRAIERIDGLSPAGMIARVRTASAPGGWMADPLRSDWMVDPLAVDAGFQMGILWCFEEMGRVSLPVHLARYRQYRASYPPGGVTVALHVVDRSAHKMMGNLSFLDRGGNVVARIEGYACAADESLRAAFRRCSIAAAPS